MRLELYRFYTDAVVLQHVYEVHSAHVDLSVVDNVLVGARIGWMGGPRRGRGQEPVAGAGPSTEAACALRWGPWAC